LPGTTLGTVAYMSPEQARAEEVDARADVFSLGLLIYESATGSQAFAGSSAAVVFEAILNRQPAPVTQLNASMPGELDRIIEKALEKDRRFRYQHASELRTDLERLRRDLFMSHSSVANRVQQPERREPVFSQPQPDVDPVAKRKGLKRVFMLGFIPGVGA